MLRRYKVRKTPEVFLTSLIIGLLVKTSPGKTIEKRGDSVSSFSVGRKYMYKLLDAINAYKKLRFIGYFFSLTYSKKGKQIYDTSFLIRFEKESFRHLILGTEHLENDRFVEKNSKVLFDELSELSITDCMSNRNFNTIVTDPKYSDIQDRLENIINFDKLLLEDNIKIYQKSQSENVLTKRIPFEFLLKLNQYDNNPDTPFLFLAREQTDSIICNPTSTFRSLNPYEQNHKSRQILSLDVTRVVYKK